MTLAPPGGLLTPQLAQAIYDRTVRRLERRFIPYHRSDRPACAFCPIAWHKAAVFFDRRRRRPCCARCAVDLADVSVQVAAGRA